MKRQIRARLLRTAAMVYHLTDRDIRALQAVAAAPWWGLPGSETWVKMKGWAI